MDEAEALASALSKLTISKQYFCDKGADAGKTRVFVNGYLAPEELLALRKALRRPSGA